VALPAQTGRLCGRSTRSYLQRRTHAHHTARRSQTPAAAGTPTHPCLQSAGNSAAHCATAACYGCAVDTPDAWLDIRASSSRGRRAISPAPGPGCRDNRCRYGAGCSASRVDGRAGTPLRSNIADGEHAAAARTRCHMRDKGGLISEVLSRSGCDGRTPTPRPATGTSGLRRNREGLTR
jgi:hypothetical protein